MDIAAPMVVVVLAMPYENKVLNRVDENAEENSALNKVPDRCSANCCCVE